MTTLDQIQLDITAVRGRGTSRKKLALEAELSEGVIWRIENKGTCSAAERARLEPILARLLGRPGGDGRDPEGSDPGSDQILAGDDGTSRPTESPRSVDEPTGSTGSSTVLPGSTPVGVDWTALRTLATGISDHDLERSLYVGPDRSQGYELYSNSEIQTFQDCRRRWWLVYYRWLAARVESPTGALAIGGRIHRALQAWYVPDGQTRVDPRTALERLIAEDWTRVVRALGSDSVDLVLEKKFSAEAVLERAMIEGYVQWLAEEGHDANLRVIQSESYVEADVSEHFGHDAKIKLIAKLDVQVERTSDGVRMFIDHKTVGEFNTWRRLTPLHPQMLHYHLIEWLSTEEGERRCDGALYNMLRKVKRTATAKPPFYDRIEVHHNLTELESFKTRTFGVINEIQSVRQRLEEGEDPLAIVYPRPTRDCHWKCDFFQVCGMFDDGSRVEDMLRAMYVSRDPLTYYGVESEEGDS